MAGTAPERHDRDMSQTAANTPPPGTSGDALDRFFGWWRTLGIRRDPTDKWAAGVASGIAHRLGVDPVLVRAAFIVLACLGGFGITVYLAAWAFLPNDRNWAPGDRAGEGGGEILAERAIRHGDGWAIVLLVVLAFSVFGGPVFAHDNGPFWGAGWLVPVAAIIWVLVRQRRGLPIIPRRLRSSDGASSPASGAYAAQWYAADRPAQDAANPYAVGTDTAGTSTGTATAPGPTPPGWSRGGGWAGPPSGPASAVPRQPRGRRRSGGFVGLLALGLALAAYGIGVLVGDGTGFHGTGAQLGLVLALATVGVLVTLVGLSGRRGGFSSVIGIVLLVVTAASAIAPTVPVQDGIGERTWRPAATDVNPTYRLGIGDTTLDLSDLPTSTTTAAHVTVQQGVGDITIKVPAGLTAKVDAHVGVGDVDVNGDVVLNRRNNRSSSTDTYSWASGSDAPDVLVDARVGLGTITIDQGQ